MRNIIIPAILFVAASMSIYPNNSVYAIIYQTNNGEGSFSVSAPAKTISAKSQQVSIQIDSKTAMLRLTVPVKSFQFTSNFMSDSLNNIIYERFNSYYMESSSYQEVAYNAAILNMAGIHFDKEGKYPIQAKGILRIHGVEREVTTEGVINVRGGTVTVEAKIVVLPSQYKIRIPAYIGNLYFREVFIESRAVLKRK